MMLNRKRQYSLFVITIAFSSCDTERYTHDGQRQNYNNRQSLTARVSYSQQPRFYPGNHLHVAGESWKQGSHNEAKHRRC